MAIFLSELSLAMCIHALLAVFAHSFVLHKIAAQSGLVFVRFDAWLLFMLELALGTFATLSF